jgi:hypothetical protein
MSKASATPRRRTPRYERLVNGRAVTTKESERCCVHPECSTKLSRYNPDDTCNVHGGWTDESVPKRGRRPGSEIEDGQDPEGPLWP